MTKWAIIGLGFISERHIKGIQAIGGEVIATCDNDLAKQAMFTNWRGMIQSETWKEVTHVSICTPNYLHYEMCKAMLDKVIVCEKPLTLSSEQAKELPDNVFTIFQLRHHPEIKKLKLDNDFRMIGVKKGVLVARAIREQKHWLSWKGDECKSGGVLFNFGVHYLDLLIHLFGDFEVVKSEWNPAKATGSIRFKDTVIDFDFEILSDRTKQGRMLILDGKHINLSDHDNLSYLDLHKQVLQNAVNGVGVRAREAVRTLQLIEELKKGV